MIHACTISDYGFLAKGLTLYESLLNHTDDIVLHYLCVDDKSFNTLSNYKSESLQVYQDVQFADDRLESLKIKDIEYYRYVLASYFTHYLMVNDIGDINYIDSDIYFYDDFTIILNEIAEKEVGVFRHRQTPMYVNDANGLFNVGVVHFKQTPTGRDALEWWTHAVLHRKYPHLATCGDQKYLDAFLNLPRDKLFIDGNIGHGAPWLWQLYDYTDFFKDGSIIWENNKQKLLFSHFSNFDYNLKSNSFVAAQRHAPFTPMWMYEEIQELKSIHENYFMQLKNIINKYGLEE